MCSSDLVDSINNTKVKTATIDAALVTFTDITQDLRKKLYEQVEGLYENSSLALKTFANSVIDQLSNMLNQTADGKYLFNGTNTDVQPMINAGTTKTLYDAHGAGAVGPGQTAPGSGAGAAAHTTCGAASVTTDPNQQKVPH